MVVENFNDEAVSVRIVINGKAIALRDLLTGEQLKPAELLKPVAGWGRNLFFSYTDGATVFDVKLPAHSYVGFEW
jgi:hypothetical protein